MAGRTHPDDLSVIGFLVKCRMDRNLSFSKGFLHIKRHFHIAGIHAAVLNQRRIELKYRIIRRVGPEDLVQRLSLRQLIDQLVKLADFLHQRVLDGFNCHAADLPCNFRGLLRHMRSRLEKCAIVGVGRRKLVQPLRGIAGQPADDLVDLLPGPSFAGSLADQQRVDRREFHGKHFFIRHV